MGAEIWRVELLIFGLKQTKAKESEKLENSSRNCKDSEGESGNQDWHLSDIWQKY